MSIARAYVVIGMQYGDEGKGTCTDSLVRETGAKLVVRTGGPQAAHNVVLPDGTHHTFAQYGSGTFAGADTYLSRKMMIEPFAFMNEREALQEKWKLPKVYVEASARIITPWHWITTQQRELARGDKRHGSCGMGVGELMSDVLDGRIWLTAGDLLQDPMIWSKLREIQLNKLKDVMLLGDATPILNEQPDVAVAKYRAFREQVRIVPDGTLHSLADGSVVFEGSQGVLLDQDLGFVPYNTWNDTTFHPALSLVKDDTPVVKIGVMRSYMTRHGAGPFVTESADVNHPDHNREGRWQGRFRQGYFDMLAARYAIKHAQPDVIALTHLDYTNDQIRFVNQYSDRDVIKVGTPGDELMRCQPGQLHCGHYSTAMNALKVPVFMTSHGPTYLDKHYPSWTGKVNL